MADDRDDGDEALLLRWREGDKPAGDRLIRRHVNLLVRFFRGRVADQAADLTQKTFLAAVEARDRVPPDVGFRPYLLGIAHKQFLMFLRTSARRPAPAVATASRIAGDDPSPSRAVALQQEQKTLLRAIRALPLDMQLCLELFYWEGLSRAEIAHVLDVELNTVKSRLQRAKARLRELMVEIEPATGTMSVEDLDRWASSLRKHVAED